MCDGLKIAIEAASDQTVHDELVQEQAEHQLKASLGYQHMREDMQLVKSDLNVHVITFDLQQNLPVPTLTHSAMLYLRQLPAIALSYPDKHLLNHLYLCLCIKF